MRYLKKYKIFETISSTSELAKDIEDILLEFSDDGISVSVTVMSDSEIQIYIGDGRFYLDKDKRDALVRVIRLTRDNWAYQAHFGSPRRDIYIYDDNRGIRSNGYRVTDEQQISYLRIFLNGYWRG